jgi:NADH:ubiquinone oxidoreductase subunit E
LRDLSLHILDLMENSIRAGASVISVTVAEDSARDILEILVEDNGPGLSVPFEVVTDPFYTTKNGKKTGLGLSLLRFRAEQAGGKLTLDKSELGGLAVKATMQLSHVDRSPLGDLAATLSSVVCTNPDLDLRYRICVGDRECVVRVSEVTEEISQDKRGGLAIARWVHQRIKEELATLKLEDNFLEKKESKMESKNASCTCDVEVSENELFARLDQVLQEYRDKPGALIPVLQIAQGIFGYLPESALKRISLGLGKSYSEVAGVVGFYSFFSTIPRGKHLIRVCLGTACYVRGGKRVLDGLKQELGIDVGETTPDKMFSLEVARCFGACGLAPTIMINDEVHQRIKPAKVRAILEQYRSD